MKTYIISGLLLLSLNLWANTPFPEITSFQDRLDSSNCSTKTKAINQWLKKLEMGASREQQLYQDHDYLLKQLWDSKISVHETMKNMALDEKCVHELRNFYINLRKIEDVIEQNNYLNRKEGDSFPDDAFGINNEHVKRNPTYNSFDLLKDLQSGDIILSRGKAYTSAAISALGEYDTQFSHLSMVYKDSNNKIWTVESHIEVGAFVRPLKDHINDKNFRTMVFRYKDTEMAAKAAEFIFKKVKKASDTTGNINYDFGFDPDDSSELFCSEIASHAFAHVSNNQIKLPMFSSRITAKKPDFVAQLGITVPVSFIPADMEVDPRFDIIAEWKNAAIIPDILQKDAVLQAMYRWSDQEGYVLNQASSFTSFTYRNIAWPLRRVPVFERQFDEKLPLNMTRKLVGYFGVLESVGKFLQKRLAVEELQHLSVHNDYMNSDEKYEFLNHVRVDKKQGSKKLHFMFGPQHKKK